MRLRLKIPLTAIIVMIVAIGICSTIMICTMSENRIIDAINSAAGEQYSISHSFQSEVQSKNDPSLSDVTQNSLIKYIFDTNAHSYVSATFYALSSSDVLIYNTYPDNPASFFQSDGVKTLKDSNAKGVQYVFFRNSGNTMLFVRGDVFIGVKSYTVYLIRDITDVYRETNGITIQIIWISGIVLLGAAAILLWLVNRPLNRLKQLQYGAGQIADGIYDKRIEEAKNDEIGDLAVSINKMADAVSAQINKLEDAAERKEMLLAALAHEIKTPMTSIIGYTESLLRTRLSLEQQAASVMHIHDQCLRLERLSGKLMQLISLKDNGLIHLKSAGFSELREQFQSAASAMLGGSGVELLYSGGFENKMMDADLISSLLLNLIDNAKKAGASLIAITATNGFIEVADNGRGIPANELDKIVQPFYTVDKSRSEKAGGIGLGLAICAAIAELHHASLQFESEEGKGTKVQLIFQ